MDIYPSNFVTGELNRDHTSALQPVDLNRPRVVSILPPKVSESNCSSSSEKKKVNIFSLIKKDYFVEAPSSILCAENKASVHFKTKSLASIVTDNGREYSDHWTMNYCAGGEDIEGILVLDKGVLTFNATRNLGVISNNLKSNNKKSNRQSKDIPMKMLGDLEVVMNGQDIVKSEIMAVPIPCVKHKHASDIVHILQISLCNHGQATFDEELDNKLNGMQTNKTPYACVYFNIKPTCGDHGMNKESMAVLSQLHNKIQDIIQSNKVKATPEPVQRPFDLFKKDKAESLQKTNLPYFEFLIRSFSPEQGEVLRTSSQYMTRAIQAKIAQLKHSASSALKEIKAPGASMTKKQRPLISAHMSEESHIVNKSQFGQILSCVPALYQMMEWKLLYSTTQNGTSFSNLMRRGTSANPFIIISKDFDGNVLGAYGSSHLRYSNDYYGTPETFLFTFKKSEEIQDYQWSKKNDMFIFAGEEGIMFGTGPFYGLWIGNDLTRGRTYPCATFDSETLCDSTDFEIARLEMWGLVHSYSTYS